MDPLLLRLAHDLTAKAGDHLLIEADGAVRVVSVLQRVARPPRARRQDRGDDVLAAFGQHQARTPEQVARALRIDQRLAGAWLRRLAMRGELTRTARGHYKRTNGAGDLFVNQ